MRIPRYVLPQTRYTTKRFSNPSHEWVRDVLEITLPCRLLVKLSPYKVHRSETESRIIPDSETDTFYSIIFTSPIILSSVLSTLSEVSAFCEG
jgi:hypothetical protein